MPKRTNEDNELVICYEYLEDDRKYGVCFLSIPEKSLDIIAAKTPKRNPWSKVVCLKASSLPELVSRIMKEFKIYPEFSKFDLVLRNYYNEDMELVVPNDEVGEYMARRYD